MEGASRDQRRLMRQRGAGTRNINNNIDFGLSFTTPTNARRSKTPSTNGRVSRRATKTPVRKSILQEPTAAVPALPETSTASRVNKRKSSFLDVVTAGPELLTGKKRRLNDATDALPGPKDAGHSTSSGTQQSLPRRRASRKSNFIAIAEVVSDGEGAAPVEEAGATSVQGPEESLLDVQEDKENDEPTLGTSQHKPKKRKSIARKFTRPKKRSSTGSQQDEQAEPSGRIARNEFARRDDELEHLDPHTAAFKPAERGAVVTKSAALPLSIRHENGVAIPTKAPRTNVQIKQANELEGSTTSTKGTSRARRDIPAHAENEEAEAGPEESILSAQNGPSKKRRKRKSIVVKKRKGTRVSARSTASASPLPRFRQAPVRTASPEATPYREADENEDETYIPEDASPEPPTPALAKKPRKKAGIVPSIESDEPAPRRQRLAISEPKQSSFPITTYRLTNASALPTITEENGANSDDELNRASNFGNDRAEPNAVDVLAQVCRETVTSALSSIRASTTGSELRRKYEALDSFGKEVDSRLFDMSRAVEDRLTFEARLRASRREKSEMQARWIEMRRKREEVALKMDRVRREHWESEEQGAEAWKLSEALHGVGVVMEREKGSETESLEYLLKTVGEGVSGYEGGGLLQKVRDFNARMERMVEVLEAAA